MNLEGHKGAPLVRQRRGVCDQFMIDQTPEGATKVLHEVRFPCRKEGWQQGRESKKKGGRYKDRE